MNDLRKPKGWGNFDFGGLKNVSEDPYDVYAPTIPHWVFMLYQMMFATITPGIATLLNLKHSKR